MSILLNCLPPTDIYSPSISLSILKSFMENNGVSTQIKYWNFSLSVMSEYTDSEDTEIRLLPFLSILNDREYNNKGNKRIISLLQKLDPDHKSVNPYYYPEFLDEAKERIYNTITEELQDIDFSEIKLFGITAKYNQWIPGMLLAEEVKKIAPHVKVIIGGFGSDNAAREVMKICDAFDFSTWGEGEYPLLSLSEQIKSESNDYSLVPRLIYRQDNELKQSGTNQSKYLDFENYIYPNYDDYFSSFPEDEDRDEISLPINSIRSCHWHRCNFCDFNQGYKLRARSPECVVKEIEHLNLHYGISIFTFVDSDTFGSLHHFERLLDLLIDLRYRTEEDYSLWAELIPNGNYDAKLMEKMTIAGFKNLFIGYDGLSDKLLASMNKSNTFSDNLFFIKYAIKNGINPVVNVIKHIPGEKEEDVQECIDNLHFLRFYYGDSVISFAHEYVELVLSSMSKYYKLIPDKELDHYNTDNLSYLLPDSYSNHANRFHLFRFKHDIPSNSREWEKLIDIENYYKTNRFSYKIQENNGVYYYTEYCNDEEIENIVFGQPEYGFVLQAAEKQVCKFYSLFKNAQERFKGITEEQLKEILNNLRQNYLIYFNADYSQIISVIEL
ncbi:B12-binding domain-containing radical SAM protein [Carboxylicivirga linearis]|uniref:Radical SAM protein n=1 Tax=Carboxylicivirga linearis TaxID=1628157 RepID=A0ABS5JRV9_9BACT|nr:radical SAM protein [Carboxylicivirga linearis]MBS2097550.1 radical SAM protein [Carboxylicivirga linearis]